MLYVSWIKIKQIKLTFLYHWWGDTLHILKKSVKLLSKAIYPYLEYNLETFLILLLQNSSSF